MAVELATAYVTLTTSARNIGAAVEKDLQKAVPAAGDKVGDESGKRAGGKFKSAMGGVVGTAAKAGGLLGGAAVLADAFQGALDQAALPATMQAEFGLTAPIAKSAAETAGKLYVGGFGASLEEIGAATANAQRNLAALGTKEDLAKVTSQASALATTFGEDVNPLMDAAAQMVKTGLAPNMTSAFDIMTKGFQTGANQGEDLIDTVTEYSGQFQKLGINGATAMGLLNQGLTNGARNSDFVADALKEFSIRAVDGSKASTEGFQLMGLNAKKMTAQIAKGGPGAAKGLQTVLDRLRAMKDPVKREAAAVALFGTKAEDLGKSLFALNPAAVKATGGMKDIDGAAQKVADTTGSTTKAQLDSLSRAFSSGLAGALTTVEPLLTGLLKVIGPFMPMLAPMAVAIGIVAAAQWLWNLALAANPIVFIIAAVIGFIALLIWAWKNVDWFKSGLLKAWSAIKTATTAVKNWIVNAWNAVVRFITGLPRRIASAASTMWNAIKSGVVTAYNWVVARLTDMVNWVRGLPGRITGAIGDLWGGIKNGVVTAYNFVTGKLSDLVGWVRGLPGKVKGFLSGVFAPLLDSARTIINKLAGVWNSTIGKFSIKVPKGVPIIGGLKFNFPQMPTFAQGGLLDPGWNLVGEQGAELIYKAGTSAKVYSASRTAAMVEPAAATQPPPVEVTVPLYLNDRVLAKSVFTIGGRDYAAGRKVI